MLRKIAVAGEGVYIRSTDTRVGLDKLFDEINKMEKQEMEAKVYSDYDERFKYVFAICLFFLLLEFFILEIKNKWLSKIKLFDQQ